MQDMLDQKLLENEKMLIRMQIKDGMGDPKLTEIEDPDSMQELKERNTIAYIDS